MNPSQNCWQSVLARATDVIRQSPFSESHRILEAQLAPSIRIHATKDELRAGTSGRSRVGGLPDLPDSWNWPSWEGYPDENQYLRKDPTPLSFIAQIDLSEVPSDIVELPQSGMLYFFFDEKNQPWGFDPRDRGGFAVLYFDGDLSTLRQSTSPQELRAEGRFRACNVRFDVEAVLPDFPEGVERTDDYSDLQERLVGSWGAVHHRLRGHPQIVQNDMRLECQLASHGVYCGNSDAYEAPIVEQMRAGASDWVLLLQIDSDEENPGWMWGDCGRIYYWIRHSDLVEWRFNAAWLCLQCF